MTGTGDADVPLFQQPGESPLLAAAVERCEKLPVLDKVLQNVMRLCALEESTVGELVAAVEGDPGLAANILRFANSAAAAPVIPVRTVRQAVTMVGRLGLRRLALDSMAYRFLERASGTGAFHGQLHIHAIQVSRLAVWCAERAEIGTDEPHLAGLLHDCGKLVLPLAFGEEALDELAVRYPDTTARTRAELEAFGADHADAGALLAAASGVDPEVARAIAWHHGGRAGDRCPDQVTACLQLADQMVGAIAGSELDERLAGAALEALGFPEGFLDKLAQAALLAGGAPRDGGGRTSTAVGELERLALKDDLTGLASRRHWLQTVRGHLAACRPGGIVLVDVDHFKRINDGHGHQMGDLVLSEVARHAARAGFAGRLGGDELAVWVDGGPMMVRHAAELTVATVRADGRRRDPTPAVTISAGAAVAHGGAELSDLLARADAAVYEAKRRGGDRAMFADDVGVAA
jgi:diguanylate cyclase (GGDEF)-like protein/putative nucleotidyltransferase with HDIG domain